ncbi:glycine betaine ABC transporter substrate-binding protein [Romboutsia sp.]|uniref:glycine betaine ABC transporter substrate-binding protein n=1 Tax=Romboutsia sp. TaxID=1965302 RepID=UPI003F30DA70
MKSKSYFKKILSVTMIIAMTSITAMGCSKKDEKNVDTIKLATKPMSEQFILAEMLKLLIEQDTNLKVDITKGVGGGTSNIHPALLKGEFDMYPEYTGTAWSFILKEKNIPKEDLLYKELGKKYEENYNLKWCGLYGFNNAYGLAIRKDIADKYNIKSYSDLSKYSSELCFGAEYDFYERDDGYDSLCKAYNFNFKKSTDLDIGLKYDAINSKQIDVMNVFTTDGQLSASDVVLLQDDKKFFQTYYCGTVIREDVLKKHPELEKVLAKMDNIINSDEMSKLNYKLETNKEPENQIAKEFLKQKGLIK